MCHRIASSTISSLDLSLPNRLMNHTILTQRVVEPFHINKSYLKEQFKTSPVPELDTSEIDHVLKSMSWFVRNVMSACVCKYLFTDGNTRQMKRFFAVVTNMYGMYENFLNCTGLPNYKRS